MSLTINLPITCDLNKLIDQIGNAIGQAFSGGNFSRQEVSGGVYISTNSRGFVIAAFNHPKRYHSATADGGVFGGGVAKSTAHAGRWAVAYSKAGLGAKTSYGFN